MASITTLSVTSNFNVFGGTSGNEHQYYGANNYSRINFFRDTAYSSIPGTITSYSVTVTLNSITDLINAYSTVGSGSYTLELWFHPGNYDNYPTTGIQRFTGISGDDSDRVGSTFTQTLTSSQVPYTQPYISFSLWGAGGANTYANLSITCRVEYSTQPKPSKVSSGDTITAAQINALNHYLTQTSNNLVSQNAQITNVLGPLKSSLNTGNRTIYPYASHYNDLVDS